MKDINKILEQNHISTKTDSSGRIYVRIGNKSRGYITVRKNGNISWRAKWDGGRSLTRRFDNEEDIIKAINAFKTKDKDILKDIGKKPSTQKPKVKPQTKPEIKSVEKKDFSRQVKSQVSSELKKLIPTNVKKYYPRRLANGYKDVNFFMDVFKNGRPDGYPQNVLLQGPTGAGKTHALKVVCEQLQIPLIRVNMNRSVTVEDFVGQWIPDENGGFKWQDGVLVRLMKQGGCLVIDEINAGPEAILMLLDSALDFREITLTQKNGEVIHAHKNFWVVACMNPDYRGTVRLNEALKDRFDLNFEYNYNESIEKKLIKSHNLREAVSKLRGMYNSNTEELRTPVSTRAMIQFEQNREMYGLEIAKECFINKFELEERPAVREVIKLHLDKDDSSQSNDIEF